MTLKSGYYHRDKQRSLFALFLGISIAFLVSHSPWADDFNLYVYDLLMTNTSVNSEAGDMAVIGIDDDTLERFDTPLVLWHEYFAQVIRGVIRGGARGVALDIIPAVSLEKLAHEPDLEFVRAMKAARDQGVPVYLGFSTGKNGQMPHRRYLLFSSGTGFLNLYPDKDEKIRKQILSLTDKDGQKAYSISMLLVKPGISRPRESLREVRIDYRIPSVPFISFSEVYDWEEKEMTEPLTGAFKDRFVFIGVTSPKFQDIHPAPVRSGTGRYRSGVSLQLQTAMTLLSEKLLRDVPSGIITWIAIGLGIISGLSFLFLPPDRAGTVVVTLFLSAAAGTAWAFTYYHVVPAAMLTAFLFIPGIVTGSYGYISGYQQLRRLQRLFKSYVSPGIMEELLQNHGDISFEGEQVTATIMFTDIRNFTTLCEHMDPKDVVAGLNRYFTEMTRAVIESGGYLNRYVGDGILAIFGAPNKLPKDGALAAARCGMNMLERLDKLNRSEPELFPGAGKIRIGIGINTGGAIVGNVGCYEKADYTINGDEVNLASRIESQTKVYGIPLLISESVYERIMDDVQARFAGSDKVKGREQEVRLYEIISIKKED
ncbi:adenylate/guanylate cyclase domain-containing protein [Desulfococcaceae bacterium HSG8]|nr:adenylate/guanylate cyclase domain-containing protein [Desulfococcaceae bacterium HSG8]